MNHYYKDDHCTIYNCDARDILPDLPKVDLVLTDPPYGVTQNKWDSVIPLDEMWKLLNKQTKTVVLFSGGLFTSKLKLSNEKNWRYDIIWDKILITGFLNANKMPLSVHETICVFYEKLGTYNPQKIKGDTNHSIGTLDKGINNNYGDFDIVDNKEKLGNMKHPKSIIKIQKPHASTTIHPTQKPIELMKYLILTYSNENDTILDFTMGSGTTLRASKDLNRHCIGIELEEKYCQIAAERLKQQVLDL